MRRWVVTAAIKRMLAERKALLAPPTERKYDPYRHLLEMIDKAAPFMDEGSPSSKWKPSEMLKIAYFIMATGPAHDGQTQGANFVLKMLDIARERWIAGRHPNPWVEPA